MLPVLKECEWFQEAYKQLLLLSVAKQFPELIRNPNLVEEFSVKDLLPVASALANTTEPEAEDTAYRVAQYALQFGSEDEQIAACIVLDKMANRPSIALAKDSQAIQEIRARLPLPLKWDWIRRDIAFKEVLHDESVIDLNRFQIHLWDALSRRSWLSASAPTSSGKSFLITKWIREFIATQNSSLVVFVVPSRALIRQTEASLKIELAGRQDVSITSVPTPNALLRTPHSVLVFTQERLQLLQGQMDLKIDLLVVDEAQKVGDRNRGILLQQVIEQAASDSPNMGAIFLSPLTENPEDLLRILGQEPQAPINSNYVAVNQNLIWVSPVRRQPQLWTVELCRDGELQALGQIHLAARPDNQNKKLAFLANALSAGDGGSVVYVNGAAEAEKVAVLLSGLTTGTQTNDRIADLIKLTKKVIHKDYVLATVLEKGIGFHYGNIPLLIREEVEELFKEGILKFLVCTSTLIEGVNLPCRSIFLMGPKKGRGNPMQPDDFWNLAGRAGRLGHEFQGNVFCIDPRNENLWSGHAPAVRKKFQIKSSVEEVAMQHEPFLDYLRSGAPRTSENYQTYDSLLSFLVSYKGTHGTIKNSPAFEHLSETVSTEIEDEVDRCLEEAGLPTEVISRNPGISPYAMKSLFEYFKNYQKGFENLVPLFPEEEDAAGSYIAVLSRINKHLGSAYFPFFPKIHGILIVNWMRGYPLSRLIEDRIRIFGDRSSTPTLIRETMDDVEQVARFRGPKFIGCYTDLLQHFFDSAGHDLDVQDVRLWLEFGASNRTQISLMAMGISRTAAVELAGIIPSDSLDEAAVLEWLIANPLEKLGLSDLVVMDIKKAVQRR